MRLFVICSGLLLSMSLVGCSTFSKLTASKTKKPPQQAVGSAEFSTSNKLKNPAKVHLAYGGWHEQAGELQEARKSYMKVLESNPKDLEAILGLARIDEAVEQYDECDKWLEKAQKYHPKDPRTFVALGRTHAARKEWHEALDNMRVAKKLSPYEAIYDYHLAEVEARSGDYQSALEHFTRAVGAAEANYNVGHILYENGRAKEAEFHFKKALQLKPDLKPAQMALAEIQAANGDEVLPAAYKSARNRSGERP